MPSYLHDAADKRRIYEQISTSLLTERATFDMHWRELADYINPARARFVTSDRNRGDKRNQHIIDSTARFSARTLASGLHAGLTSPARPWMKLTTPDPDLAKFGTVKVWLHEVTQRLLTIFATSNLYNVLPMVYYDIGTFGTAAMSLVLDSRDLFRCYSYPIGSYALGLDARGLVTTFVQTQRMTVRQIVEQFGVQPDRRTINWSTISASVKAQWERGDYETSLDVTWIIKPNEHADPKKLDAKYLPWSSCYYETGAPGQEPAGGLKFLRESGFRSFPILAPRWDITGNDTYGTDCPGMMALGDVKQLQIQQRKKGQLLAKAVDPPLMGPTSLRTQKTSLLPGDITYQDVREGAKGLAPIHEVRLEGFQHLTADMGEVQYRIQRAYYEDLFLMIARSDDRLGAARPTAREIEERHEEKLLALGPVLERTNDELLDPLVDRAYEILEDAGLLPPPPEELSGVELKVEYISILAEAQKLVGVAGQDRFLSSSLALVEVFPQVRHKIDIFQVVDNYGEMLGVDPRIVRPTEEAEASASAEAQAMAKQAEAEQMLNSAKAMQAASQAPITGDTALSRMVQGAAAQAEPANPAAAVGAPAPTGVGI